VEELKAQAESLGIDVDGRWSEKRIQAEIDKALEAPAAAPVAKAKCQTVELTITPPAGMSEEVGAKLSAYLKKSDAQKPVTVTNLRDNPNKRLGLKGRGQIVLTADQLGNKQLMARIMHGVESGVLGLG
jgi:hypothetical protein